MKLAQFNDLRVWHQRHWRDHPLEKGIWEGVVTLWLMGCVGAPTAALTHAGWALALCGGVFFLPGSYVSARRALHRAGILRCDWIGAVR